MSKKIFIGLGGSGGQIIQALYRILKERGELKKADDVICIIIDTEREALRKITEPNLKTICISSKSTVAQTISELLEEDEDIGLWCPIESYESAFHGSDLDSGASQMRIKSRLSLAKYLKDDDNMLKKIISGTQNDVLTDASKGIPRVLIASSIAGGTGSGIFIQIALYVRKLFEDKGVSVKIDGLFACPDIYLSELSEDEQQSVKANAYAAVRELNALSLISGEGANTNLDIDMEISSKAEGSLFVTDKDGKYSDTPYNMMYFVGKTNLMTKELSTLANYYEIMAGMAYTKMYSEASGRLIACESNIIFHRKRRSESKSRRGKLF